MGAWQQRRCERARYCGWQWQCLCVRVCVCLCVCLCDSVCFCFSFFRLFFLFPSLLTHFNCQPLVLALTRSTASDDDDDDDDAGVDVEVDGVGSTRGSAVGHSGISPAIEALHGVQRVFASHTHAHTRTHTHTHTHSSHAKLTRLLPAMHHCSCQCTSKTNHAGRQQEQPAQRARDVRPSPLLSPRHRRWQRHLAVPPRRCKRNALHARSVSATFCICVCVCVCVCLSVCLSVSGTALFAHNTVAPQPITTTNLRL